MIQSNAASSSSLSPEQIRTGLELFIDPARILIREIERIAFASDASFYRLTPLAVVQPRNHEEIAALFRFSRQHSIPLVFRAGGTSLSGQSISDGILVDVGRYMRSLRVEDNGKAIRLQPGVIGKHANDALQLYRARIGPDPASINSCRMGGILSNNASGMCCGVVQNAYHTLRSITFMLPSGTLIDSASAQAENQLEEQESELCNGLRELRRSVLMQSNLATRIRQKYKTKNTTGYALNAFLDFERPIDIFSHLLIGAEGTLGWIAEAVLNTVPDMPIKLTGLLIFDSLRAACSAIQPLKEADAAALELMDRAALRSVENQPGMPQELKELPPEAAALLVEFQYAREAEFLAHQPVAHACVASLKGCEPTTLTRDPVIQAQLWKMRKGMFPSVGAVRAAGTTAIIEDVAFPVERLADAALDLRRALDQHGYHDAILFGHAKDGNLHFVLTQGFLHAQEIDRYRRFMEELVSLVVSRYDGALKAEHGTGRNMAPFVETEWGPEAMQIMRHLKDLVDPDHLLNPGVILNADPQAHLKDLKGFPEVEAEVDKCIECGYCEPHCPSRDLSLTPRQRIVVRREMQRLRDEGASPSTLASLEADFPYMALDTCAVDGLCASECPVGIDTGQLTKRFRANRHSDLSQSIALQIAQHFSAAEVAARLLLRAGHGMQKLLGVRRIGQWTQSISHLSRRWLDEPFWQWSAHMPHPAKVHPPLQQTAPFDAVWFPACITRVMGKLPDEPQSDDPTTVVLRLAQRAGICLLVPPDIAGNCCGVPFSSKGFTVAHEHALNQMIESMDRWSNHGQIPIVVDTSPCTLGLRTARSHLTKTNQIRWDRLTILDSIDFVHDTMMPRLTLRQTDASVALHTVCSAVKMKSQSKFVSIANACSQHVVVPEHGGCCAFAGDRGLLVPELTASATCEMAKSILAQKPDRCYSSSRTCEMAMTSATGFTFRSFLYLLDESSATQP